jgi:hypothetical protein
MARRFLRTEAHGGAEGQRLLIDFFAINLREVLEILVVDAILDYRNAIFPG